MSREFTLMVKKLNRRTQMNLNYDVYAICETGSVFCFVREDDGCPDNFYIQEFNKQAGELGEPILDGCLGYCISELEKMADNFKVEVEYV